MPFIQTDTRVKIFKIKMRTTRKFMQPETPQTCWEFYRLPLSCQQVATSLLTSSILI